MLYSVVARCFTLRSSPLFEIAFVLVRFDHVASVHRKRESRHDVNGCNAARNRLRSRRRSARHTTADRMAAHRKSDRRRDDLCAGGLRKRVGSARGIFGPYYDRITVAKVFQVTARRWRRAAQSIFDRHSH